MTRVRRWLAAGYPLFPLIVLIGLSATDDMDQTAFRVLIPDIRDAFHVSDAQVTTLAVALVPVVLLLAVPIGFLGERVPRVVLAVGGQVLRAMATVVSAVAGTIGMLAAGRVGVGIGRATVQPTHQSLLADFYPPDARPGVFSGWRMAYHVGNFAGAILAGAVAVQVGWRWPLVIIAGLTAVFVVLGTRLREPSRGGQERRLEGASAEVADVEEEQLGWEESWRSLKAVGTVRRVWRALPFLLGGVLGLLILLPLFYQDVFHVNAFGRGVLIAVNEPFSVLGLVIGLPLARRLMRTNPPAVLRLFALMATVGCGGLALLAEAPTLTVAAIGAAIFSMSISMVTPGLGALASLIIPPRVRTFGFGVQDLWTLPGLVFVLLASRIAAADGMRAGMLAMVPVFAIGAWIIGSAGSQVNSDIKAVRVAALARSVHRLARRVGAAKLLICRGIGVRYEQVQVLFGVDFDVADGEIVALLGTNGAGKSTLLKAISGLVDPFAGAIVFDGADVSHSPAQRTLARGVVYMPGGRAVFPTLSVEENLRTAAWRYRRDEAFVRDGLAATYARFPALRARRTQPAGNLSGGEQQMLGLSMALLSRPKLLMIDELSLGLAPAVVADLLDTVREINRGGTTVVLVEQSVDVALRVASRAVFMEKGEVRFEGPTADLFDRPDVLRSVFLEGAARAFAAPAATVAPAAVSVPMTAASATAAGGNGHGNGAHPAEPQEMLRIGAVSKHYGGIAAVREVSMSVAAAEIVGVIGPNGAGKTTLFDIISGFVPADSGWIILGGRDVTRWSPHARARAGLGRSFQDARLFPSMTVRDAIALALDRHVRVRDPLTALIALPDQRVEEAVIQQRVDELIELAGLQAFGDKFLGELSTGSRRIVDIVCALGHDPRALLLDEPSSGIAQRETEALAPLIRGLRDWTGCALVVIEHDMGLITSIADRIVALHLGEVIAEGTPAEVVRHPAVVAAYLGSEEVVDRVAVR